MSATKRALAALAVGVASAGFVYGYSDAANLPHIWPGTIFAFVFNTASNFAILSFANKRGGS